MDWLLIVGLIFAGLLLVGLEVYVPGFVLGSIGVVLMIIATALCYQRAGWAAALAAIGVELALGVVVVVVALKYFPKTGLGQKMILAKSQTDIHAQTKRSRDLIGREGVAQSTLRPSGVGLLDGKRLDVVAESGMIERGSAIRVVAVEENRILVRKV